MRRGTKLASVVLAWRLDVRGKILELQHELNEVSQKFDTTKIEDRELEENFGRAARAEFIKVRGELHDLAYRMAKLVGREA